MGSILTLKRPILNYSETFKKSKFVAFAGRVQTERDATQFLAQHHDSKATHHCWAFRLTHSVYRVCDDGEPSGTAGSPILTALDACSLQQVMVIVRRYYGGVKLGTGGLIRAYHHTTRAALASVLQHPNLRQDYLDEVLPTVLLSVHWHYKNTDNLGARFQPAGILATVYRLVEAAGGTVQLHESLEEEMHEMVSSVCTVSIPMKTVAQFENALYNATKGQVSCTKLPASLE
jgi:putative IMPACT (imprinted ancient) family translation regulator